MHQFAGRYFRRIDLLDGDHPIGNMLLHVQPQLGRAVLQSPGRLIEDEEQRLLPAFRGGDGEAKRERGFSRARRSHEHAARAPAQAAPEQGVEFRNSAREILPLEVSMVLSRHEPREDDQPSAPEDQIVAAFPKLRASDF